MQTTDLEGLNLSDPVRDALTLFTSCAIECLGDSLDSIILYGSAAEGRVRRTSDINLIVFLRDFIPQRLTALRSPLRIAHAAINAQVMFPSVAEVQSFVDNLGLKSTDVLRKRVMLHGTDPFQGISVSRTVVLRQLQQTLFQLKLRLRNHFVTRGMREEQLAHSIADIAGPLRSVAAAILELKGKPFDSRKTALELLASELGQEDAQVTLGRVSEARENAFLPAGISDETHLGLLHLCERIDKHVRILAGSDEAV